MTIFPTRPTRIGVVLLCGAIALVDGADGQALAIAAPLIAHRFALPAATVGLMFAIAALGSAIGYLGGGWLADRWGARRIVPASLVMVGAFQIAGAWAGHPAWLIAARFAVAIGLSGAVPGLIRIVSLAVAGRLGDRVLGLIWACFPLGVLGGSLLNGWILHHFDWPAMFVAGGIAPLALALAGLGLPYPSASAPSGDRPGDLATAITRRDAVLAGLVFLFAHGAVATVMNWTPSLLAQAGYAAEIGAQASAASAAGALVSMALSGWAVARARFMTIVLGFAVAVLALGASAAFIGHLPVLLAATLMLGAALGLAGTAATFLPGVLLPPAWRARGLGLGMAIGRAGQMLFPGLVGLIASSGPFVFLAIALLPAGGAVAALALARGATPSNLDTSEA
jgi:MFS transporter, AAHS family, 4-hydroxybenzoate transporter